MSTVSKVNTLYAFGAAISVVLAIISAIFIPNGNYMTMIFFMSAFGSYVGVIWRGRREPKSWGKTNKALKNSALVGFTSIFLVPFIASIIFVFSYPSINSSLIITILFIEFGLLTSLAAILYYLWFRRYFLFSLETEKSK